MPFLLFDCVWSINQPVVKEHYHGDGHRRNRPLWRSLAAAAYCRAKCMRKKILYLMGLFMQF